MQRSGASDSKAPSSASSRAQSSGRNGHKRAHSTPAAKAPLGDRSDTVLRMPSPRFAISATVAQAPAHDRLEVLDAVVAVDDDGTIAAVEPAGSASAGSLLASAPTVVHATPDELLLPGLI